ncbi:MAG: Rrf2 family transcriptional regulator [Planctomycetes bacterium]|nr:Rrf2 family transcriptional regulator [Planctomycetota bacterium]
MLRISKKADYAVFLLGAIAREGAFPGGSAPDSVVSAHEIASSCGLNKSVVANLLKDFARSGLLESVRGLRGGYRLARAPGEVSLGAILEVVEGKFELVDCIANAAGDQECALIDICPSRSPMRIVHDRIRDLFDRIRLDELCRLPAHGNVLSSSVPGSSVPGSSVPSSNVLNSDMPGKRAIPAR